jgi:transcriptional regulator GlxA family with amidase domain
MAARTERSHPHLTLLYDGKIAPRSGASREPRADAQDQRPATDAGSRAHAQGVLCSPFEVTAVRDAQVQRAIERMRAQLDAPWTVTKLARSVGLSRPAFARRFVESTGLSPLKFLTRCRMERAAELLRTSDVGLRSVAERVGYGSEFAFNRAFKRHFQVAPGSYRRMALRAHRFELRMAA